jgi:hypothetical protein
MSVVEIGPEMNRLIVYQSMAENECCIDKKKGQKEGQKEGEKEQTTNKGFQTEQARNEGSLLLSDLKAAVPNRFNEWRRQGLEAQHVALIQTHIILDWRSSAPSIL